MRNSSEQHWVTARLVDFSGSWTFADSSFFWIADCNFLALFLNRTNPHPLQVSYQKNGLVAMSRIVD